MGIQCDFIKISIYVGIGPLENLDLCSFSLVKNLDLCYLFGGNSVLWFYQPRI